MVRLAIILSSITIFLLLSQSLCAQSYPSLLTYNETNTSSRSAATSIYRIRSENENYLEAFFLPDTIPHLNIAVLENALGDVFQDSSINIIDLLRLRDIIIGRPPAPSMYELSEGDITHDGTINSQDLYILRDILLFKIGVPYVIDSIGGQVLGDGIIFTIPPRALDSAIVISVRRTSESEFSREMGVDTKGALQDSAYFMAAFEIISTIPDFKLPVNATIKLDSIPPCAYQGLNGLFTAVPDRDGDGRSELFLINELQVNTDSLTLTTHDIPIPSIQMISVSQVEPGKSVTLAGAGFGKDPASVIVRLISTADADSLQNVIPSYVDDSTLVFTTPSSPSGMCHMQVIKLPSRMVSNIIPIEILSSNPVVGDIRTIIIDFYTNLAASFDSRNADSLFKAIEDTTVRNYIKTLRKDNRACIDSTISYFVNLPESLISNFVRIASFIQNITSNANMTSKREFERYTKMDCSICDDLSQDVTDLNKALETAVEQYNQFARACLRNRKSGDCDDCIAAEEWRKIALDLTDEIAETYNEELDCECRNCPEFSEGGCDECPETEFIGFGPQGQAKVSGGYGEGGFSTNGVCINIKRYQRNQCSSQLMHIGGTNSAPVPIEQRENLKCPPPLKLNENSLSFATDYSKNHAHTGSIVKITNAIIPYNIVGILNENGRAFIPHVPMNRKVTFSVYDPVSGLYDPNAGTYTTGSTPGGFDRPILLFRPNTSIRNFAINIGDLVYDSVTQDMQRIDYSLNIGASDASRLLNIGFSSTVRLSFHIEDPDGNILFDNMNLTCYINSHVRFNKIGRYYIRVAFGVSAQPGQFGLGITVSPSQPLPSSCLCDDIVVDTLYEELSPYEVSCPATIASGDTIVSEAGVILEFSEGGIINANGVLTGTGSQTKPISFKYHMDVDKRKSLSVGDNIKNGTQRRKEVEP